MKKKFVLGLTSLVVASSVAIGGTLAFMTNRTQEMTNTFTAVGDGISGIIREPHWDAFTLKDNLLPGVDQPTGATINPLAEYNKDPLSTLGITGPDVLGLTKASAMTPGRVIPKDPTLGNTSKVPVYMAMKVTYGTTITKFNNIATLDLSKDWLEASDTQYKLAKDTNGQFDLVNTKIYFYVGTDSSTGNSNNALLTVDAATRDDKGVITAVGHTTPLFNNVTIRTDAVKVPDTDPLYIDHDLTANEFNIKLTGAAVQTTDLGSNPTDANKTAMNELVKALSK